MNHNTNGDRCLFGLADRIGRVLASGEGIRLRADEVRDLAECGAWDRIYRHKARSELRGDNVIELAAWRAEAEGV